jgi:hypothetical protein
MNIRFNNGTNRAAALLTRTPEVVRVAYEGSDDATELRLLNGTWVTDDCEPVRVEFAWDAPSSRGEVREADCICPPELAAQLVQLLYTGSEEEAELPPAGALPGTGLFLSAGIGPC